MDYFSTWTVAEVEETTQPIENTLNMVYIALPVVSIVVVAIAILILRKRK